MHWLSLNLGKAILGILGGIDIPLSLLALGVSEYCDMDSI
jgi:hypothetical protein